MTLFGNTATTAGRHHLGAVATIGVFDGVHRGHIHLLKAVIDKARSSGLRAIVFTFSNHPLQVVAHDRAPRLIVPLSERMRLLRGLGFDSVVALDFTPELMRLTARQFVSLLHRRYGVDCLVMGFNNRFGSDGGASLAGEPLPLELSYAEQYDGPEAPVSSSIIRRMIADGNVAEAERKLGRPFTLAGTVAHGYNNGTSIGFPTANILPPDGQLLPAVGAYVVLATIDGDSRRLPAMAAVGYRPTIVGDSDGALSLEVNIFNFDADLYGKRLTVEFIDRLRDERRMSSLDELRGQLERDRRQSIEILTKYNNFHYNKEL